MISAGAFEDTKLTSLDLSKASSLVEIGDGAFVGTDLAGTLTPSSGFRVDRDPQVNNPIPPSKVRPGGTAMISTCTS